MEFVSTKATRNKKAVRKEMQRKPWNQNKPRIDDYNNIGHGWRRIKESIVQSAEEILTREKPAPKREWITMEIVQDIERKRLLKNKTDEESKRQYKMLRNKINREAKKSKRDVDRKKLRRNWQYDEI